MAEITSADVQGNFTKALIASYVDKPKPKAFLQSFFRNESRTTKTLSIEVQRGTEYYAVDVARQDEGNINEWKYSTEKIFYPPYFKEKFYLTDLELYERLFGAAPGAAVDDAAFRSMINDSVKKLDQIKDKITRTKELWCKEIFEFGTVSPSKGAVINYARKAGSFVTLTGSDLWLNNGNVFNQIQAWCEWLRQNGLVTSMDFDLLVGSTAIQHFSANTVVTNRQNLYHYQPDELTKPKTSTQGSTFLGQISAGPYRVNIWTYPEYYQIPGSGVKSQYLNPKKVVLLPAAGTEFIMGYAATPQLIEPGQPIKTGEFIVSEFVDQDKKTHEIRVESCPLPVPVTIDMMLTAQVVA